MLRRERLAQGIELSEAEARTKIRVRYLRALEAEDFDALPGEAYVRGFLRSYADFLGLDGLAIVEQYRRLAPPPSAPAEAPEPAVEAPRPLGRAGARSLGGGYIVAAVAAGIVAVLALVGVLSGGSGTETASKGRHHPRHASAPPATTTTTTTPSEVTVRISPTAEVWVCLVDQAGRPLVDGQILEAGDVQGPFTARRMELSLGNGSVRMKLNGERFPVPDSPNPLGYELTPTGARDLSSSSRPTCT